MGTRNQNATKESNTTESGANLTPREKEVVDLAADGLTDKEIAAELQLSTHTVATYWRRLRTRFNLPTRTAVVVSVLRQQANQAETRYETELVARQKAEAALAKALDQANSHLNSTASNLGNRIKNEFRVKSELETYRKSLNECHELMLGARAFIYAAETTEPHHVLTLGESCAALGIDREKTMNGEAAFFEVMDPEDLGRIMGSVTEADTTYKGRLAFLYRQKSELGSRYALDISKIYFNEQGKSLYYGGIVIDVQDLVDLGVIDPDKGVKFRLPSIQP